VFHQLSMKKPILRGYRASSKVWEVHFEQALKDAHLQGSEGYVVKDLRAFNVVFT
jgi:hypothetical protein